MEMIRVIREMREATNGEYPKFVIWENVCFDGDTLITCDSGYKPIKNICVGDKVKTLSGKYHPVAKTYRTDSVDTIKIRVSGGEDIVCTRNHPFYVREKQYKNGKRIVSDPFWISAEKLTKNHLVAYKLDVPTLSDNFITKEEAWALGRYIADGSVDLKKNTPRIFISVGDYKIDVAREHLYKLPYEIHENKPHATATNFVFSSAQFYSLVSKVGIGAGNKQVPPFVFSLPIELQAAVLDGYCCGDGSIRVRGSTKELKATTASRILAYGIARLIRNIFHVSTNISVYPIKNGEINGRIIKANYPCYTVNACLTSKVTTGLYSDGIMWQPVKEILENKKTDVYNLSVLEDNTYGANDVFVHNCGAFSSNGGNDFQCVLEKFANIVEEGVSIPRPKNERYNPEKDGEDKKYKRWSKSGAISGNEWSIAWRLFDAQYWGVPQRRQRIALIMDLRGQRAAEVLFERTGMSGNSEQSISAWKAVARTPEECTSGNDRVVGTGNFCASCSRIAEDGAGKSETRENYCGTGTENCCCGSCREETSSMHHEENPCFCIAGHVADRDVSQNGAGVTKDKSYTLDTIDKHCVAYTLKIRSGCEGGGKGALIQDELSATLSTLQDQTLFCMADNSPLHNVKQKISPAVFESHSQDARYTQLERYRPTVAAQYGTGGNNMPLVAETKAFAQQAIGEYKESEQASAMMARDYKSPRDLVAESHCAGFPLGFRAENTRCYDEKATTLCNGTCPGYTAGCILNWIVRRLTPVECERLQGFPDGWTDIGEWIDENGKKHKPADSPRYKALGNSIALPQWFWIAQKMEPYLGEGATLGSLFDGISGFPLVWTESYGKDTARWSSEIESYCVAVAKYHFPEN